MPAATRRPGASLSDLKRDRKMAAIVRDAASEFAQEAVDNFLILLDDLDYNIYYEILGIGRFQFLRQRQMFIELKSLHIALWRLAISSSFPNYDAKMFTDFLEAYSVKHPGKVDAQIVQRAPQYWGMISPIGDSDFSGISRHLISFFPPREKDLKAITLKLALRLHVSYRFIFDRLI